MYAQKEKLKKNKSRAVANPVGQMESNMNKGYGFQDNRPEFVVQRKLQEIARSSPHTKKTVQLQSIASTYFAKNQLSVQSMKSAVQRVAYNKVDGSEGETVNVNTGDTQVEATGRVSLNEEMVDIVGSVGLSEDEVVENQVVADGSAVTRVRALRVFGLQAEPRRQRLGQLLTYHHALEAQNRGIQYVIARSVSGAGGPFYLPLGFRDFIGAPTWQSLKNEKGALEQFLGQDQLPPTPGEVDPGEAIAERYVEVVNALANAAMFIPTADLIANSLAAIQGRWEAQ